ncbi:MAG: glycoside hydrolase family 13 protein [Flavobacteriaceae bacterium]|nr:glycoside hydrolase family 13 protein [Flavobacteriaceae bacterium]
MTSTKRKQLHKIIFIFGFFLSTVVGFAQIDRVEPPNWWVGFQNKKLQLLVHGKSIAASNPSLNYPGVSLVKTHKADSPNYLFLDLAIDATAQPGTFEIVFTPAKGKKTSYNYELKKRERLAESYVGFDHKDVLYLITPDRFANGNPSNDSVKGLLETAVNRQQDYGRHGGDIAGITQHVDYLKDMGFTAVWPSPLLENDMPQASYHGYAITDFYKVDPRFGNLEDYKQLANKLRQNDLKLIMDMVANHCGREHWWMNDLPFKDWVNQQDKLPDYKQLKNSNHRRTVNQDRYAAEIDKRELSEGWFVPSMPDLNQRNPFMANYLIQNSIWWVETLGLGGIRQDTYPYPDKNFMSDWAGAIMQEYPNFSIVGEEWSYNPLLIGYWQDGAQNADGYDSNLTHSMDFAMQKNTVDALNEPESWNSGLVKIYEGLANDFHYTDPNRIMVFPDNHDMDRIFTALLEDIPNTKMALSYLLSLPRVAQLYYGTEILLQNTAKPGDHGLIRTDFPGGWHGDAVNAFTGENLNPEQADMQSFLKKLLQYRKSSSALQNGKTLHFAPENGVYVLFRIAESETFVHIINKNEAPFTLDLTRFEEVGLEGKTLKNIITGASVVWNTELNLAQRGSYLFSILN